MASVSRKYKEAQERWIQHCHDIERSTAKIPKGTEQERKNRIARARKDYRYFVRTYFPHLATTECADFQVDAAVYMRDHENARGLFEWARGHAKSTHISLLQPLWLKIQPNAQPLIMILVSKSQEAARRHRRKRGPNLQLPVEYLRVEPDRADRRVTSDNGRRPKLQGVAVAPQRDHAADSGV